MNTYCEWSDADGNLFRSGYKLVKTDDGIQVQTVGKPTQILFTRSTDATAAEENEDE